MNKEFENLLAQFDYQFPSELIATEPAHPRDSARLLVYNRSSQEICHDTFKNLANYLPKNSVLVLNQTKVLPARLEVTKPTGGKARLLYIKHDPKNIWVLSDRKLETNSQLSINSKLSLSVQSKQEQFYLLKPSFTISKINSVLEQYGQTPLPPYIKNPSLKGKRLLNEYNTVFAKELGSVAAPTASLHFTKGLLSKIKRAGIDIKFVTLHVNLGTFAPLTEEHIKSGKLHAEYYEIDTKTAAFLNKAKKTGRPIISAGTTSVRTLESAANSEGVLTQLSGNTTLFIKEHSKLKFVDKIITNFHVPKSSLLMLVSAFVGRKKLLALYKIAVNKKYRLFSFGDGMLIL